MKLFFPNFLSKFEGKEIEFIFLAALSPKNLWKENINKYALGGYHHWLNEKEYY
ncbi:MAG: hypothetical protein AAFO07_22740 [Bacteroidota bacterium]